jgi:hypothetical protein
MVHIHHTTRKSTRSRLTVRQLAPRSTPRQLEEPVEPQQEESAELQEEEPAEPEEDAIHS